MMWEAEGETLASYVGKTVSGEWVDVTDEVENYKHGKTVECPCGQGIGVEYGELYIGCASCDTTLVDFKAGEREPPEREAGQSELSKFT